MSSHRLKMDRSDQVGSSKKRIFSCLNTNVTIKIGNLKLRGIKFMNYVSRYQTLFCTVSQNIEKVFSEIFGLNYLPI